MKQLGNLVIVCAKRPDVLLQTYGGNVFVYVGEGPQRTSMYARWDDDKTISEFVRELNYGKYARKEGMIEDERSIRNAA